jgi:predicted nucleic acid-binding protein
VRVVCNTSPLLLLAKIQRLALLHELYTAILIPVAVLDELGVKPDQEAMQIQALVASGTFTLQPVMLQSLAAVPATLGQGEREAIALAIETAADLAILDDQQGCARARGAAAPTRAHRSRAEAALCGDRRAGHATPDRVNSVARGEVGACLGKGGWGKLGNWIATIAQGGLAHARRHQDHRL